MATVRINARIPELFHHMRTAMLAPSTNIDRALTEEGWCSRDEIQPGTPVEQVTIISRDTFAPGDTIDVYNSANERIALMNVLAIRLVSIAELTDDELFALGFENRSDVLISAATLVMDGKAWWLDIERLNSEPLPNAP